MRNMLRDLVAVGRVRGVFGGESEGKVQIRKRRVTAD